MKCAAVVRKPHIREASSNAKPNLAYTTGIVPGVQRARKEVALTY